MLDFEGSKIRRYSTAWIDVATLAPDGDTSTEYEVVRSQYVGMNEPSGRLLLLSGSVACVRLKGS